MSGGEKKKTCTVHKKLKKGGRDDQPLLGGKISRLALAREGQAIIMGEKV